MDRPPPPYYLAPLTPYEAVVAREVLEQQGYPVYEMLKRVKMKDIQRAEFDPRNPCVEDLNNLRVEVQKFGDFKRAVRPLRVMVEMWFMVNEVGPHAPQVDLDP